MALDEDGHLLRICSLTLLIFPVEDVETVFDDILVLNDSNDNKQIVAVTKKNELGESHLQLLNSGYFNINFINAYSFTIFFFRFFCDIFFKNIQLSPSYTIRKYER